VSCCDQLLLQLDTADSKRRLERKNRSGSNALDMLHRVETRKIILELTEK